MSLISSTRERGAAEKILSHAGEDAPINITAEVEDAESTEILVEAGFGISFALEHVCDRTNPNMAYVPFEGEGGQARLLLCWNKRHPQEDIRGICRTLQNTSPCEKHPTLWKIIIKIKLAPW